MRYLFAGLAALALLVPARSASTLPEGNWRFSQNIGPVNESPLALLKLETKDGKLSLTIVEEVIKAGLKVSDLKVDGKTVSFAVEIGGTKYTFEGVIDPKDEKVVRGSFSDGTRLFRGSLNAQEGDKVQRPTPPKPPEEMAEAQKLLVAPTRLRIQAQQAKDVNEKAELQGKAKEAQKEADEKVPGLYREVLAKHADSPLAADAANALLRMAAKVKPKAEEVATWLKVIDAEAGRFGPKIATDSALQAGEMLVGQKDLVALALPLAERVEQGIKESDPLATQSRALKLLARAEKAAGKTDAGTEARLAKVEKAMDEEYVKKVPPFKPEKFAGRKDKAANRVAVMELFTGAQCPPCVAADAAFDALEKAYESRDLILIQYHMHIPGPDPLTNKDTIARWDYYREKFPQKMGGVPSSLFNGKPQAGGGGGMPNARVKFDAYQEIINAALEEKADLKVTGSATRAGDKVSVAVELDGVKEPGEKVRLRVLLVEEKVKYVGGNGMRFHHMVVRALPGGPDGTPVTEKEFKKSVDVDLAQLRTGLTKYLDEFAAERPFPNPDRPMEFAHLKAIALVQDDATGEILNAAEFAVTGK
jgi:hypothetical protein